MTTHLVYRPDIDGLRAVAVIGVVGFHMQMSWLRCGYVGVDVFFVISGYLISSILLSDLHAERFSLREFYIRRIRRILPALVAAMLFTSALGMLFSLPAELLDYAKSLIAAALSAANLYFGLFSNYFDSRAFSRLAIQTWSLGVEEQFYLLFPLLLWLLHRKLHRHLGLVLSGLAAASFVVSCLLLRHSVELAFFMPWSRAWELLTGTFLAMSVLPPARSALLRNTAALLGLVMIAVAIYYFGGVSFPGASALVPCLGAALVIWSGQGAHAQKPTLVARLLATRPMVFVGLISYSLYLFHWPIVVFVDMGALWGNGLPVKVAKTISLVVMFTLAMLSWRFVERPFREGRFRLSGAAAFRFAGVATALMVTMGVAAVAFKGFPQRFPARGVEIGSFLDETLNDRMGSCLVVRARAYEPDLCLRQDPARPNWLLVGDSHAAAQWPGLVQALPQINFLQATHTACAPDPERKGGDCAKFMQGIFGVYLATHHVDRIIAESRWLSSDIEAINRLVAWAQAHHIPLTVIGPTQDYTVPLPRLLATSVFHNDPGLASRYRTPEPAQIDRAFAEAAATRWHVPYISLVNMFCRPAGCQTFVDPGQTIPLMLDTDHFTNEGSLLAAQRMVSLRLLEP